MGVKDGIFQWVRVVTISRAEDLKVALQDDLNGVKTTDWEKGLGIIRSNVSSKFHRTPMAEYEYLMSAATPSTGILIAMYILVTLLSCGLLYWAHEVDIFGDEGFRRYSSISRNLRRW